MCTCIGNVVIIMLQSLDYKYVKNINCSVTIVDVYTKRVEKANITGDKRDDRTVSLTGGIRNERSELHDQMLSQIGAVLMPGGIFETASYLKLLDFEKLFSQQL